MSPEAGWLLVDQIIPRLRSAIPNAVPLIAPETAEEVIQDGVALAAKLIHSAELAGKRVVQFAKGKGRKDITAGSIAFYAISKLRCGRRSTGSTVIDVHGAGTQINGNSRLESFDQIVSQDQEGSDECFMLHDVLGNSSEDVAMAVARKMDYEEFYAELPAREKAVVKYLVEGLCGSAIARKLRVTSSTIQTIKKHLAKALVEFMGPQAHILQDVQRRPLWRESLDAIRQKNGCRYDRCH
jgi:hypothetical protein